MNKNVLKEIVSLKLKIIDSSVNYIDSKMGLPIKNHYRDLIEVINESIDEFITIVMRKAHCFSCGMDSIFMKIIYKDVHFHNNYTHSVL